MNNSKIEEKFLNDKKAEFDEAEKDARRKKLERAKKILIENGFPYKEFLKRKFNIDILNELIFEIYEFNDLEKEELEIVSNSREKSSNANYKNQNIFYNLFKPEYEKDCTKLLRYLLIKLDDERYKNITFDGEGNIWHAKDRKLVKYSEEEIHDEEDYFLLLLDTNLDKIYKLLEKVLESETLNIDCFSSFNAIENKNLENFSNDRNGILKLMITFIYTNWYKIKISSLNEAMLGIFNQKVIGVEEYLDKKEGQKELLKFLYRNESSKKDNEIKEKLKKIYIFDEEIPDYSLKENCSIDLKNLKKIDAYFKGIYFNKLKYKGHKLSYYITLYRDNLCIKKIDEILIKNIDEILEKNQETKWEKINGKIKEREWKKIEIELKLNFNKFYTSKELDKFLKKEKSQKKELHRKNSHKNNSKNYLKEIYKILLENNCNEYKFDKVVELVDNFKIESTYNRIQLEKEEYLNLDDNHKYITSKKPVSHDIIQILSYSYYIQYDNITTKRVIEFYLKCVDKLKIVFECYNEEYKAEFLTNELIELHKFLTNESFELEPDEILINELIKNGLEEFFKNICKNN